jgi:hypothetical protein
VGEGVGIREFRKGVRVGFLRVRDGRDEGVERSFIDEHVVWEGSFESGVVLVREVWPSGQGVCFVEDAWFVSYLYVVLHDSCDRSFSSQGQFLWLPVIHEICMVGVYHDVLTKDEVAVLVEPSV